MKQPINFRPTPEVETLINLYVHLEERLRKGDKNKLDRRGIRSKIINELIKRGGRNPKDVLILQREKKLQEAQALTEDIEYLEKKERQRLIKEKSKEKVKSLGEHKPIIVKGSVEDEYLDEKRAEIRMTFDIEEGV